MQLQALDNPSALSVTANEAARLLGVSPRTLANWRVRGGGPAFVRLGESHSRILYRVPDLEEWLRARVVATSESCGE